MDMEDFQYYHIRWNFWINNWFHDFISEGELLNRLELLYSRLETAPVDWILTKFLQSKDEGDRRLWEHSMLSSSRPVTADIKQLIFLCLGLL